MKKNYLLTPGPTPLPPEVCESLSRPIIHHRTPQFQAILKEAHEGLKYIFQTTNEVFILTSSGTGGLESAVINFLSPGDMVLSVDAGKFGERWAEICKAYGVNCEVLKVEWGKAVDPKDIEAKLKAGKGKIKAVFTTLCETSTGVATDIKTIGSIVKDTEAILVVDAVSGLGAIDLQADAWNCDVVVSGSQKGLMLPPGLGFISVSPKAWKLAETSKCPKYYFDLKAARKAYASTDTPWTPAIGLVIALNEAIRMMKAEGLEKIFSWHNKMAEAVRMARGVTSSIRTLDKIVAPGELPDRKVMRRSIVARHSLPVGHRIARDELAFKRPGNGIEPRFVDRVVGSVTARPISPDEPFGWDALVSA